MSTVDPQLALRVGTLTLADLARVMPIEMAAYSFPWSRGNFIDSLAAGYVGLTLFVGDELVGYGVAMHGVDETHLLNLTVAPAHQRRGHGLRLLDAVVDRARRRHDAALWLEVRESNVRAREIYERYGFRVIGRRKGYYPDTRQRREDAIVMSLSLKGEADGVG